MPLIKTILILLFINTSFVSGQDKSAFNLDYYGEEIGYSLKASFFTIGSVDIAFRSDSIDCGAYILVNAKSTGVVSFIKDVQYKFDACIDTSLGQTIQSSRIVREGSFIDRDEVFYDRSSNPDSTIVITEDNDSIFISKEVEDILFALFYFRKNSIHPKIPIGTIVHYETFFVDKEWDLHIKYLGKEKIETEFGFVNCHKFQPKTEIGKYFNVDDGMTIWITDNKYHIPVRFKVELKFASFYADIISYSKPFNKRKTSSGIK